MTETIMVFCAHSDDQILGPGGTLAKFASQGAKIITVIFSFGSQSHPHLKKSVIRKTRVAEAKEADKIIGGSEVLFLGLKEKRFKKHSEELNIVSKLKDLINKHKPSIIFTHSYDDKDLGSLDHPEVNKIVMTTLESINYNGKVYAFDVWNPFNFKNRFEPRIYFDITETFGTKLKAIEVFESQQLLLTISSLIFGVYLKAIIYGLLNNWRYAERFYVLQ